MPEMDVGSEEGEMEVSAPSESFRSLPTLEKERKRCEDETIRERERREKRVGERGKRERKKEINERVCERDRERE